MIEVFKTNINCPDQAKQLVEQIHKTFTSYKANFDLEDCDRVLKVVNSDGNIALHFTDWLKKCGCHAEILPDN
jgi:hypothetical protein